jgi:hypothetical protein
VPCYDIGRHCRPSLLQQLSEYFSFLPFAILCQIPPIHFISYTRCAVYVHSYSSTMRSIDSSSTFDLKALPTRTMTLEHPTARQETLLGQLRSERKLVWYILSLMSGVLLYGYDFVVVGTVSSLLAFQYVDHHWAINRSEEVAMGMLIDFCAIGKRMVRPTMDG